VDYYSGISAKHTERGTYYQIVIKHAACFPAAQIHSFLLARPDLDPFESPASKRLIREDLSRTRHPFSLLILLLEKPLHPFHPC
jgi:hypothetical protein